MEVLLFDGSMEGFLTAVYHVYINKRAPLLFRKSQYAVNLVDTPLDIPSSEASATRVRQSMQKKFPLDALKRIQYALNHESQDAPRLLLQYVMLAFKDPRQSLNYQDPLVMRVERLAHQVRLESHRFKGFIRFSIVQGIYVAKIDPDHDILEFLPDHFLDRYQDQRFLIVDTKRRKALLGQEGQSVLREGFDLDASLHKEDAFAQYWRTYFDNISIASRKNPKAQKRSMPVRYWKNLTETHPEKTPSVKVQRESDLEVLPAASWPPQPRTLP